MPTPHVILNGQLLPAAEARISPLGDGFQYGHGAFETLKARRGRALWLADHLARLTASCTALALDPPRPVAECSPLITRLLAKLELPDAAVKIIRFRDFYGTAELITARPSPYTRDQFLRGFTLRTHRQGSREGRLTPHKSLAYLENLLARRAAQAEGADEALFVTPEGRVLEGASTSIFAVKDAIARTPPLASGILPGTARARVFTLAPEQCFEAPLTLDDLLAADEVFVTNAVLGVMPVSTLDQHAYSRHAPFTHDLRQRWLAAENTEANRTI